MTTGSVYLFLLSENAVIPLCEAKCFPLFGSLYWSCTWRQPFFFDLDRLVTDLAWKISHGVLYTAKTPSSKRLPLLSFNLQQFFSMTSTAMESSEDFHDVQELQGNNSWSNLMEEEVVKADHANKEEPQGTP